MDLMNYDLREKYEQLKKFGDRLSDIDRDEKEGDNSVNYGNPVEKDKIWEKKQFHVDLACGFIWMSPK